MVFAPFLAPVIAFLLRDLIVKFLVFTAVFALVGLFVPMAINHLTPFVGTGSLSSAFGGLSPGVWFFLDAFELGYGMPLIISALVSRFLIRRLPVIG